MRAAAVVSAAGAIVAATVAPALADSPYQPFAIAGQKAYSHVITSIGKTLPSSLLTTAALADPEAGSPSITTFSTSLTRNPDDDNAPANTTPSDDCGGADCKEVDVTVPGGAGNTLYARIAWQQNTQYAQLWAIAPDGTVYGQSDVSGQVDKTVGNEDVAPLAEFNVKDPAAGVWKIQARAAFGVNIPIAGEVALTKGAPLSFPTLDVNQLADKYLTQNVTYNIVFVNRTWSKDEVAAFRADMTTELRNVVLEKQFADGGCDNESTTQQAQDQVGTLVNWGTAGYCGTAGGGETGNVPYFEPLKAEINYRFLQADDTWTGDLFKVMQENTTQDQPFEVVKNPLNDGVSRQQNTQGNYNPTVGDKIDPFPVEDWIFNHRDDAKYAQSFTNVETGAKQSGGFINPDPKAYFDPFYTATGSKNLDVIPQGADNDFTFFAMDTFDGPLAAKYFRSNAYHYFDVSKHEIDPDLNEPAGPDYARAWGGRYRFFMHDLGAGPNFYEANDTVLTKEVPGSADYPNGDPPIWDYTNNPEWSGMLASRTARDASVWLAGRFEADYLYRPVPADVYFLADNNWEDCYSNPVCSPQGISHTILEKVYNSNYVTHNLSAALPGATFTNETQVPGLQTFRYLGCATDESVSNPNQTLPEGVSANPAAGQQVTVPDPNCVGKTSDPLQELLEAAKSRGSDTVQGGVNDAGASAAVVRAYVEQHRDLYAPQPVGQFTITNISVVFPGATTWDLPALVGGVAFGTPNNEAWGVLNDLNDRVKTSTATDCSVSSAAAPGCGTVPPISTGSGLSYTLEHESSHFFGLTHPHDYLLVEKDADGKWDFYNSGFSDYPDFSMAPTTYAGAFAPYSVLDQDTIQRGHTAEYLRQAEDYLHDAYTQDGMAGLTSPSAATQQKVAEATTWINLGSQLHSCGDYLHAERAMRNASLAAQGTFGPIVEPRQLQPGEKVLFAVNPQPEYDEDGQNKAGCFSAASAGATKVVMQKMVAKAATKKAASKTVKHVSAPKRTLAYTGLSGLLPMAAAALVGLALLGRRSRRSRRSRRA